MPALWQRIGWVAMAVLIGLSRAGFAETDTVRIQRPIDLATLPLLVAEHEKLIEKQAEKRGGEDVKLQLDEAMMVGRSKNVDLVALEKALMALAELDERQSKIVGLRYFSGLSIEETAEALGISHATVKRDWAMRRRGCIGN